ncbi:MAG: type II toxin-antitoxin system RelE/ParE family toxin [Actinomycetales bacterium]|nr:type II toxin-antitoxin system RelE/ParE family toxin [Actinomycetales bacterium]
MPWEILIHSEVAIWLDELPQSSYERVIVTLDALRHSGPTLGRPLVDRMKDSKFHNLKELRPLGTSLRILFAFDFKRRAVLLVAGDKSRDWRDWYKKAIPIAEVRFQELLNDSKEE